LSITRPPNWYFWFENIPSGNPDRNADVITIYLHLKSSTRKTVLKGDILFIWCPTHIVLWR
jgi:hypothetical protein